MVTKINMEIAREIRKNFRERIPRVTAKQISVQGLHKELADEYKLGVRTVQSILTGNSWKEKDL